MKSLKSWCEQSVEIISDSLFEEKPQEKQKRLMKEGILDDMEINRCKRKIKSIDKEMNDAKNNSRC